MEDHDLELVSEGKRQFAPEERQWALSQHHFLSEYVRYIRPEKLSDEALAGDVLWAGRDYVRCTM